MDGYSHYKYLVYVLSADILSLRNPAWIDVDDPFHYFEWKLPIVILCATVKSAIQGFAGVRGFESHEIQRKISNSFFSFFHKSHEYT